jgi:D-xylose transport system permease protein
VIYQTSLIGMMAVAMTVVLISGNFDLSVASVAAFSAVVLVANATLGFWPAFGLAMGAAMLLGFLNGAIVQYVGINAFIVTLGTMTAVRGLILLYTDGRSVSVTVPEVTDVMKAFEGGAMTGSGSSWRWVAALLAWGAYGLRDRPQERADCAPATLGTFAGRCFPFIAAGPRAANC